MRRAFSSLVVASSSSRRLCSRLDDDDRRARCFFCRISRRFWSSSTSLSSNDCTNDDDDFGATLKTIGNRWFLGHSSRHGRGVFALRDVVKNERIFFDDDDDDASKTHLEPPDFVERRVGVLFLLRREDKAFCREIL